MTFVDTGAWFALLVPKDPDHAAAAAWMAVNTDPLLTTDYVIDETLTLLRVRGERRKAVAYGTAIFANGPTHVHYLTPAEISDAWNVFRRFADKDWSFTDCTSKVVVEALGIASVFGFDHHFRQFGTVVVVP